MTEAFENRFSDLQTPEPVVAPPVTIAQYPHYFKAVPLDPETGHQVTHLDIYNVLDMFAVFQPGAAHAVKKILCAGDRGVKSYNQDLQEAIDSLQRQLQINTQKHFTEAASK